MTNRVGQQLGNYQILRLLGKGGFADVYLGEHIYLKTQAAIKVLHTELTNDTMGGFLNEAQTIARLAHPHIVRVLEFGVDGSTPFLVMEYAPNGTLRQYYPRGTRLPLSTIVFYVKQVASALQYAHNEKVVHRDVKPENILLRRNNEVMLGDFGIATIAQTSRSLNAQEISGTVAYMAPEQIQGKPQPASDQYALGIIVYEWLTGACPFQGSFLEIASQHMVVPPPSLRQKIPTIPDDVEQVVMIALAKEPQKRFMVISAFAAALEEAVKSEAASTFVPEAASNTPTMTSIPPTMVAPLTSASQLTPSWPATERSPMLPSLSSPSSAPDISTSSRMKAPFQGKVSRRNVILGLGGLAVAGSGIAAFSILQKQFSPSLAHNTTLGSGPTSTSGATHTTAATPTSTPSPQPTISGIGTTRVTYRGQYSRAFTVSWSHDGTRIVSGGNGATSEVWDAATGSLFFSYNTQASTVYSVKYSPDGTRIASGDSNGIVQIWDAATGTTLVTCTGHAHQVNAVNWSPDGSRIASASGDKTVRIWDASTGNSLYTYTGHPHYVNAVAWSPSGSYVASGGGDTTVQVWDPTTGNVLNTYRGHSKDVLALSWLYDSSRIASASSDKTIQVWDPNTLNTSITYTGHFDIVVALDWSPDGRRIASGGVDRTVQVWSAASGQTLFIYRGHSNEVEGVAWSPISPIVASASDDGTVRVWQAN